MRGLSRAFCFKGQEPGGGASFIPRDVLRALRVMAMTETELYFAGGPTAKDWAASVGILVDSEIVLSTSYGKTMVFINKNLINRDRLSTRPYQQRPVINKFDSW